MPKHNGHDSWNAWNISLWISNDEGLYRLALDHIRWAKNKDTAALNMFQDLKELGLNETPDGAPYTKSSIRKAMFNL